MKRSALAGIPGSLLPLNARPATRGTGRTVAAWDLALIAFERAAEPVDGYQCSLAQSFFAGAGDVTMFLTLQKAKANYS
jgi:hypothetical protein